MQDSYSNQLLRLNIYRYQSMSWFDLSVMTYFWFQTLTNSVTFCVKLKTQFLWLDSVPFSASRKSYCLVLYFHIFSRYCKAIVTDCKDSKGSEDQVINIPHEQGFNLTFVYVALAINANCAVNNVLLISLHNPCRIFKMLVILTK